MIEKQVLHYTCTQMIGSYQLVNTEQHGPNVKHLLCALHVSV